MVHSTLIDTVVSYLVMVETLVTDDTTVIQEVIPKRELAGCVASLSSSASDPMRSVSLAVSAGASSERGFASRPERRRRLRPVQAVVVKVKSLKQVKGMVLVTDWMLNTVTVLEVMNSFGSLSSLPEPVGAAARCASASGG